MRFANEYFSFERPGPTLVLGRNVDNPLGSSNGAGKSSLFEALLWGLFGRLLRPDVGSKDVVRLDSQGGCMVEVQFSRDNMRYAVQRYQGHKFEKNNCHLSVLNDGGVRNEIERKGKRGTDGIQVEIDRLLGCDFSLFVQAVIVGQDSQCFVTATDAEKKRILEDTSGLTVYNEYLESAKKRLFELDQQVSKAGESVRTVEDRYREVNEAADSLKGKSDLWVGTHQKRLSELTEQIGQLDQQLGQQSAKRQRKTEIESDVRQLGDPVRELTDWQKAETRADEAVTSADRKIKETIQKIENQKIDLTEQTKKIGNLRVRLSGKVRVEAAIEYGIGQVAKIAGVEQKIASYRKVLSGLREEHSTLSGQLSSKRSDLTAKNNEFKAIADTCPTCKRPFDSAGIAAARESLSAAAATILSDISLGTPKLKLLADRIAKGDELLAEQENLLTTLRTDERTLGTAKQQFVELNGLEGQISLLTDAHTKAVEEANRTVQDRADAEANRRDVLIPARDAAKRMVEQMDAKVRHLNNLKTEITEIDNWLAGLSGQTDRRKQLDADLTVERQVGNPFDQMLSDATAKRQALELEMRGLADQLDELRKESSYVRFWVQGFGPKGCRSLVMDRVAASLTEAAAERAAILTDGTIQVSFTTQRMKADGEYAEDFRVQAVNAVGSDVYAANSVGERQRTNFAVIFALRDHLRRRTGTAIDLLACDEALANIDPEGSERVMNLLRHEQSKGSNIFFITHDSDLQNLFTSKVTVVKEAGVSRIEL